LGVEVEDLGDAGTGGEEPFSFGGVAEKSGGDELGLEG
jgi:hypothetical protein